MAVLAKLSPITGWAAYYRGVVSSRLFSSLDHYLWQLLYKRATWSHANKPKSSIVGRRFGKFNKFRNGNWVFGCDSTPTWSSFLDRHRPARPGQSRGEVAPLCRRHLASLAERAPRTCCRPRRRWIPASGSPDEPRKSRPRVGQTSCAGRVRHAGWGSPDSACAVLSPGDLHASLRDPVLDTMNFLNKITNRYPKAISFTPGRWFAIADQPVSDGIGPTRLLADELAKIKSMVRVNTSALGQAEVAGMLLSVDGRASELNVRTAAHYGKAMSSTLRRLDECLPRAPYHAQRALEQANRRLLHDCQDAFLADNAALARSAEDFGVIWTPLSYFYPQGGGERVLRLSISYLSNAEIDDGAARLAASSRPRPATPGGSDSSSRSASRLRSKPRGQGWTPSYQKPACRHV